MLAHVCPASSGQLNREREREGPPSSSQLHLLLRKFFFASQGEKGLFWLVYSFSSSSSSTHFYPDRTKEDEEGRHTHTHRGGVGGVGGPLPRDVTPKWGRGRRTHTHRSLLAKSSPFVIFGKINWDPSVLPSPSPLPPFSVVWGKEVCLLPPHHLLARATLIAF